MNAIRASDAERDRVAHILEVAAGDGRLTAEEAGERLALANSARFRDELTHLLEDLPVEDEGPDLPRRRMRPVFWFLFGGLRVALFATLLFTLWGFARFWMVWALWPLGFLIFGALARARYRWRGGPWGWRGWRGHRTPRFHPI
jgi:hypothetical protein